MEQASFATKAASVVQRRVVRRIVNADRCLVRRGSVSAHILYAMPLKVLLHLHSSESTCRCLRAERECDPERCLNHRETKYVRQRSADKDSDNRPVPSKSYVRASTQVSESGPITSNIYPMPAKNCRAFNLHLATFPVSPAAYHPCRCTSVQKRTFSE